MSEVARLQSELFVYLDLAKQALLNLQAQGLLTDCATAEQWEARGRQAVTRAFYQKRLQERQAAGDRLAHRAQGEPLAVVLNDTWGDVAGIAATATGHGPAGELIGGIHSEDAAVGQQSGTERDVQRKLELLQTEHNRLVAHQAADMLAQKFGGRVSQRSDHEIRISLPGVTAQAVR